MTAITARAEVGADRTLRLAVPCDLSPGPVEVVVQLPGDDGIPPDLAEQLAGMKLYTDEELWRAGRVRTPDELASRSEELNLKRDIEGLTASEVEESDHLARYVRRVMLVRATAAALLRERGQDVSGLLLP